MDAPPLVLGAMVIVWYHFLAHLDNVVSVSLQSEATESYIGGSTMHALRIYD